MTRSILALILLAAIVGCRETERSAPEHARTLRLLFQSGPDSLDPGTAKTARAAFLLRQFLGASLCERGPDDLLRPLVALDLPERTPDGWRLRLRPEAVWPDGRLLGAADFCRGFDLVKEGRAGGLLAASWTGLEGYVVETPLVFRVLTKNDGLAAREQIATELLALPPDWQPGEEVEAGLGPYRLVERDRNGLLLERRETWWGDDVDGLRRRFRTGRLEWRFEPDQVKTRALLQRGEVDLAAIDPEQLQLFDGDDYARLSFDSGARSFVGFNCRKGPTTNRDLRRILAASAPREIAESRPRELEAVFAFADGVDVEQLPSLELARRLEEAGFLDRDGDGRREGPEGATVLRLLRAGGRIGWLDSLLVHWQERLAQLGLQLEIESLPVPELLEALKAGRFDLFVLVWRGSSRFDSLRDLVHADEAVATGRNFSGFRDARCDELVEAVESASSEEDFELAFRALAAGLAEEAPIVPLFRHRLSLVLRSEALGLEPGSQGPFWPSLESR